MTIETIPLDQLSLAFLPVAAVVLLMWRWQINYGQAIYAVGRMLLQLLLIGYALVFIFGSDSGLVILAVLGIMVVAAAWIALNTVTVDRRPFFLPALVAIGFGGGLTLLLITQGVLRLDPWYRPSYIIPLAGMIFANSMTALSIALERLHAELENGRDYLAAQRTAFRAAMIPVVNSLFAVGLIALPGMMTGQILSGVSPFVAARYQIMVMCMIFGSAGISAACFLWLLKAIRHKKAPPEGQA